MIRGHKTLVKSTLLTLSTVNRSSGSRGNPTFDFPQGMIHSQSSDLDSMIISPIQVTITRDWASVDYPDNLVQVIAYPAGGEGWRNPAAGVLMNFRIPPGNYAIGNSNIFNNFFLFLNTQFTFCKVAWDPCTNKLAYLNKSNMWFKLFFPTNVCALFGFPLFAIRDLKDTPLISDYGARMLIESNVCVHADLPVKEYSVVDNLQCNETFNTSAYRGVKDSNVFVCIPLDINSPPGAIIAWKPYNTSQGASFEMLQQNLSSITLKLTTDTGKTLNPYSDWTIAFKIDFYHTATAAPSDPNILEEIRSIGLYLRHFVLNEYPPRLPATPPRIQEQEDDAAYALD